MSANVTVDGKAVLITGANNGVGFATPCRAAELDALMVMICRDRGRGVAVRQAALASERLLLAKLSFSVALHLTVV